jgi:ABC-type transport system involved in cytochrome bd biosynthesis fused ATPase/permease subunit
MILYCLPTLSEASDILATLDIEFPDMSGLEDPDVSSKNDIQFQNVSFAYPSRRNVQVLDQVNITFEAQKTTAIVGPSGSGKSTIVGLLERWYDLDDYQIPKQLKPRSTKPLKEAVRDEKAGGEDVTAENPPIGGHILIGYVDL